MLRIRASDPNADQPNYREKASYSHHRDVVPSKLFDAKLTVGQPPVQITHLQLYEINFSNPKWGKVAIFCILNNLAESSLFLV
jgi:hypothetical protein